MKSASAFLISILLLLSVELTALAATNTVEVFSNDFGTPPNTHIDPTINVGDTVEWSWVSGGTPHSTTAAAGQFESWDSGLHTQPFTFDHTFTQAGTFNYYCTIHGFDLGGGEVGGMSGHVVVLGSTPHLTISKSVAPDTVSEGGSLTYTITIGNNGSSNATAVTVSDALPANTSFMSADSTQGTCTQIAGVVTCNLSNVNAAASATVTLVVLANAQTSICNTASVSSAELSATSASACASGAVSGVVHDLAVVSINAPKTIALTSKKPSQTKFVRVTIQNRSPHNETIADANVLANLVTLDLTSAGTCAVPQAQLVVGPPQRPLPVTLKPKQKFTAFFTVTYDCANDSLKGSGHEDFSYTATVHHEAIDGQADSHAADDMCPHDALGIDNIAGLNIKDVGCGGKKPGGGLGAPVTTDVTVK